jgi:ADP-heptose:LPS heptosyltransferase
MNTRVQKIVFGGSSRLTEIFPVFGARALDATFRGIGGSPVLSAIFERRNRKVMKRVKAFRRFLVVSDIHIGDAALAQSTLTAIRDFFPDAEIDYVINKMAAPIIEGNPDATRIIPLFSEGRFPSSTEIAALREIIRKSRYDLCLMLCPFMKHKDVADSRQPFVSLLTHSATILQNENDPNLINHFSYQEYLFVRGVLSMVAKPVREDYFRGVRTTYTDDAIENASAFYRDAGLSPRSPVIMYNPDSACKYNMMPFVSQAALLQQIARDTIADTRILLGEGHTEAGIGTSLFDSVSSELRSKIRIIPKSMRLEVYSALIDFADVFVTGDTGPLHLAASRRYSRTGNHQFRNRTAVLSFFGATTPRMSGYDSFQPGFLASNQDAPSWCYQAGSRCRNITCLNKMFKTCKNVLCFEQVDVNGLATLVASYVNGLFQQAPAVGKFIYPDSQSRLRSYEKSSSFFVCLRTWIYRSHPDRRIPD